MITDFVLTSIELKSGVVVTMQPGASVITGAAGLTQVAARVIGFIQYLLPSGASSSIHLAAAGATGSLSERTSGACGS